MKGIMSDYLFVLHSLQPKGGSELASAWMLQALAERGSVTVLTHKPDHDLAETDRVCGTNLSSHDLQWVHTDSPALRLMESFGMTHQTMKFRSFVREARRQRVHHRYLISSFGDADLGVGTAPAIQYLHVVPGHHSGTMNRDKFVGRSLPMLILAWLNLKLCDVLITDWDDSRTRQNYTLANSHFISEGYRALYGRDADAILYPPPMGGAVSLTATDRKKYGFVAMARAHIDKGWDDTVGIVEDLRALGHDVTLQAFVLTSSSTPEILNWLQEKARANTSWFKLCLNAPRKEIDEAIACHRFGLHAGWAEAYGMAVAELMLGGCLTAVRKSGGQTEIVTEPELQFWNRREAVQKWDAILRDPELEARLLASQAARSQVYSRETFLQEFRNCLDVYETAYQVPR